MQYISRYFLHTSGDEAVGTAVLGGIRIVSAHMAEMAPFRQCVVALQRSVDVENCGSVKCSLFVNSVGDGSTDLQKEDFYDELVTLVCVNKSSDAVVLTVNFM